MANIAIIGAGPAGLKAAEILATAGHNVTVYDQKPSPARKFLMAGRGGLNITHSEPIGSLITRYGAAANFLRPAITQYTPQDLRDWCAGLGNETFVGSSGRVFPKYLKSSPLLRAWMIRLGNLGVKMEFNHEWYGWGYGNRPIFKTPKGEIEVKVDAILLALGGASWARLGSTAKWVPLIEQFGITVNKFKPANCGFYCSWSKLFIEKFARQPLKNISVTHHLQTISGEAMITDKGIEGGVIYALSSSIRKDIENKGWAQIEIDLKPDINEAKLIDLLSKPHGRDTLSNTMRKVISLSPVAIGLLMEDREITGFSPRALVNRIKHYPLKFDATFPIDRAISSAGGIALNELTPDYMLKKRAGIFVAGEMLDWEAPTGGYLLQATFSTAVMAANGIIKFLA